MTTPSPGYTTTEFWGKVLIQVFSIVLAAWVSQHPGSLTPDQQQQVILVAGLVVPGGLEALYGFYRTWVKRAHALAPAAAAALVTAAATNSGTASSSPVLALVPVDDPVPAPPPAPAPAPVAVVPDPAPAPPPAN